MKGKGNTKRTYKKGDQCVQNPGTRRHRDVVKKNVISQRKSGGGKNYLLFLFVLTVQYSFFAFQEGECYFEIR